MMSGLERHSTGKKWSNSNNWFIPYLLRKDPRVDMLNGFGRMPLVNNNTYLELAKRDFNRCQVQHQLEWHGLQKYSLISRNILLITSYFSCITCLSMYLGGLLRMASRLLG
jgi:hypothetical protein